MNKIVTKLLDNALQTDISIGLDAKLSLFFIFLH